MKFYRIKITGWTASFRYPIFIYGYQPTLPVPPLSTVYGLVSAACGKILTPDDVKVKFVFKTEGKAIDIETVYEWGRNGKTSPLVITKTNIMKRELLFNPQLYLYFTEQDKKIVDAFVNPVFPLLLGRSSDLAMVEDVKEVTLAKRDNFTVGGTILPFPPLWKLSGMVQALPTHFSPTLPRRPLGTRPWFIVKDFQKYKGSGWVDEEKGWGVIIEERRGE